MHKSDLLEIIKGCVPNPIRIIVAGELHTHQYLHHIQTKKDQYNEHLKCIQHTQTVHIDYPNYNMV